MPTSPGPGLQAFGVRRVEIEAACREALRSPTLQAWNVHSTAHVLGKKRESHCVRFISCMVPERRLEGQYLPLPSLACTEHRVCNSPHATPVSAAQRSCIQGEGRGSLLRSQYQVSKGLRAQYAIWGFAGWRMSLTFCRAFVLGGPAAGGHPLPLETTLIPRPHSKRLLWLGGLFT